MNLKFQYKFGSTWLLLTDTRIRKILSKINFKLGLTKTYITFRSFRRSGATLAFNSQVSVQRIKDCPVTVYSRIFKKITQLVKILLLLLPNYCNNAPTLGL